MAHIPKKKKNGWPKGIFRDIFVCARQELSPFGTAFVSRTDNVEEQNLGVLFGIIIIDDRSEESSYVTNLLVSVMKKEYFTKPHRPAEESFEAALRKANLALSELARHGSLGWSGKLNFASGALERNNLHFACLGNVSAFLFRNGQISQIGNDLDEESAEEPHPLKTFSNVSSGKLEKGDKLVFASHDLTEIFSAEELRQNASHFSREEFPGFLEMSLSANSELAGVIVIDLAQEAEIAHTAFQPPSPQRTEFRESGSAAFEIPPETKKIDSFVGFSEKSREPTPALPDAEKRKVQMIPGKKFAALLGNFSSGFSDMAKQFFLKVRTRLKSEKPGGVFRNFSFKKSAFTARRWKEEIFSFFEEARHKFQSLSLEAKKTYLRIFGAAALVVAASLIIFLAKNKKSAEPVPQPENIPSENQSTFPIDDIEARKIENVEEFAAFGREMARIALMENFLYSVSGNDKSVAKINLETKEVEETKSDLQSGNFELLSAMPHLKTIFLLSGDRKAISFTPVNKKFQENNIALPANLKSGDIRSYLTYLYVLDTANNQIYRFPRSEGGFGEGQNWLRSPSDLKNAKGIVINDDLYLAERGKITAYLQGKIDDQVNFESPRTPLSIDRIYSEPGGEFVWVLDSDNHRVLRFEKSGKISAQFFGQSISGIKDFAVDEKNKAVYLLKGSQILKFSVD